VQAQKRVSYLGSQTPGTAKEKVQFPLKPHQLQSLKRLFPKFIFVYDLGTGFTTELLRFAPNGWGMRTQGRSNLFHLFAEHGVCSMHGPHPSQPLLRALPPVQVSFFFWGGAEAFLQLERAIKPASAVSPSRILLTYLLCRFIMMKHTTGVLSQGGLLSKSTVLY